MQLKKSLKLKISLQQSRSYGKNNGRIDYNMVKHD